MIQYVPCSVVSSHCIWVDACTTGCWVKSASLTQLWNMSLTTFLDRSEAGEKVVLTSPAAVFEGLTIPPFYIFILNTPAVKSTSAALTTLSGALPFGPSTCQQTWCHGRLQHRSLLNKPVQLVTVVHVPHEVHMNPLLKMSTLHIKQMDGDVDSSGMGESSMHDQTSICHWSSLWAI